MKNENCSNCMNSIESETSNCFNDLTSSDIIYSRCNHKNSPYYGDLVNNRKYCRLFEDETLYFLRKDRKDKIDNLNNSNKF